jgi:hypothetical protein
MERLLFSRCARMYDRLESDGLISDLHEDDDRDVIESIKELNLDVSTEEFLDDATGFACPYADLFEMLGRGETIAWLTPHPVVASDCARAAHSLVRLDEFCRFCFFADGRDIVALARSPEDLSEICDIVLRLLAADVVHSVTLENWGCLSHGELALINSPALAYLMEQQRESLKYLSLKDLAIDENHCRVLGAYSKPGLEIVLLRCNFTSAGTIGLVEVLRRNQGPTGLDYCVIDNFVLADGLHGNRSLKSWRPRISDNLEVGNRELIGIASALKENKGLVDLHLTHELRISDEAWGAVCDSLKTHPTLQVLNLHQPYLLMTELLLLPPITPVTDTDTPKIQALVGMLKVNMSIHTIHLDSRYRQHKIFRESVIPYLETNRLRPQVLAIQKTRPITYRAKVLGRALLSTCSDANSFWMLLSGNAEVASTTMIAAAVNLPTPATANDAVALTTATTGSLPKVTAATTTSAATPSTAPYAFAPSIATDANVATPSAGQKRKSCP